MRDVPWAMGPEPPWPTDPPTHPPDPHTKELGVELRPSPIPTGSTGAGAILMESESAGVDGWRGFLGPALAIG